MQKDKRAVSPALSTVILTAAGIVLILVAMNFANSTLSSQLATNEFNGNKQFMATAGLQIDDLAWTIGRTQTITYSSKFGFLNYNESALTYNFQVYSKTSLLLNFSAPATGVVEYNMPISAYSLGNNYFERIPFSSNGSFLQSGSSAPVSQVFCEEKLFNNQTSYSRIAIVPTIRVLSSTITAAQTTSYFKFYLPYLVNGGATFSSSPCMTLTGENVTKISKSDVAKIVVTISPNTVSGFDSTFFNFANNTVTYPTLDKDGNSSVVEFYFGEVQVIRGHT